MDRRITRSMAALGLGFLAAATGCQSFLHRATVPPAPRSQREGGQVGFSSSPKPAQSAMNGLGQPNGPIANMGNPSSTSGLYGKGRGSSEGENMPGGRPAATAGDATPKGTLGDAPPAF